MSSECRELDKDMHKKVDNGKFLSNKDPELYAGINDEDVTCTSLDVIAAKEDVVQKTRFLCRQCRWCGSKRVPGCRKPRHDLSGKFRVWHLAGLAKKRIWLVFFRNHRRVPMPHIKVTTRASSVPKQSRDANPQDRQLVVVLPFGSLVAVRSGRDTNFQEMRRGHFAPAHTRGSQFALHVSLELVGGMQQCENGARSSWACCQQASGETADPGREVVNCPMQSLTDGSEDVTDLKTPVTEEVDDIEPLSELHCSRRRSTTLSTVSTCASLTHRRSFYESTNSVLTDAADDIPAITDSSHLLEPSSGSADCLKRRPDRKPKPDDNIQKQRKKKGFEIPVRNGLNGCEVGIFTFSNKNENQTVLTLKYQIEHKLNKQKLEAPVKRQQLFHGTEILEDHVDLFNLRDKELCLMLKEEKVDKGDENENGLAVAPRSNCLPAEERTEAPHHVQIKDAIDKGSKWIDVLQCSRFLLHLREPLLQLMVARTSKLWDSPWTRKTIIMVAVVDAVTSVIMQRWLAHQFADRREGASKLLEQCLSKRILFRLRNGDTKTIDHVSHSAWRTEKGTALVSDIAGFTSISEKLKANSRQSVQCFLDRYLEVMGQIVEKFDGEVDKIEGDGVFAFFFGEDHAERAYTAAMQMLTALRDFNAGLYELLSHPGAKPEIDEYLKQLTVQMRIGLHAGEVLEGNFGSIHAMKFGVIGGAMHEAAKLEDLCKDCNTSILASQAVFKLLPSRLQETLEEVHGQPVDGQRVGQVYKIKDTKDLQWAGRWPTWPYGCGQLWPIWLLIGAALVMRAGNKT